jgi:hypothetical protein
LLREGSMRVVRSHYRPHIVRDRVVSGGHPPVWLKGPHAAMSRPVSANPEKWAIDRLRRIRF